jgi:hypothetical protein
MKHSTFALFGLIALASSAVAAFGAAQTITFIAVPPHVVGDVFDINPTTDAIGLTPVLTVVSGPATVQGNTITTIGAGFVTLQASQAGNNVYSAAAPVTQVFAVSTAPATVTLSALDQTYDGAPKPIIASTVPLLLPVTVTYNGSTTPPFRAGSYFVSATISDPNYQGFATGTLIIGAGGQSIRFGAVPIPTHVFGDVPFTVSPTASSGLPVTLRVLVGPATIDGTTVTLIGAGVVVLQATQAGDSSYAYASLTQSFVVAKIAAPVVLTDLAQPFNGSARSVVATSTPAGLIITVTYNGTTVPPTAAGSYDVVAKIDDENYQGLAVGTLTIAADTSSQAAQAVSFGSAPIPNHTFGDAPFNVIATASSGLPVVLSVASGPATVSGNTVVLTGAGLVTLLASQPGDVRFAPTSVGMVFNVAKALAKVVVTDLVVTFDGSYRLSATTVPAGLLVIITYNGSTTPPSSLGKYAILATVSALNYQGVAGGTLQVGPGAQTITFPEIPDHTIGDLPFTLSPTATSGLPVVLSVVSGPAVVVDQVVTLTGVGMVILQASQAGNTNFAATAITQSFYIAAGNSSAPQITGSPFSQTSAVGGTVVLTVAGSGSPAPVYQWFFNSLPIAGATSPVLTLANVQLANAGSYTVTLTNVAGLATTRAATLIVTAAADAPSSRIVNFSARAVSGVGSQALIVGFVTSADNKDVLVRGIGPGLAAFGVSGTLADPMLSLYDQTRMTASNDDWENGADANLISSTSSRVGAFALPHASKDAALIAVLGRGVHTMSLARPGTGTGVAMEEVYDLDANVAGRLINVSARMQVGSGDSTLIAGFVISGNAPKTVLLRGAGPSLAAFGVTGELSDPQIALYSATGAIIAANDNWGSTGASAELSKSFAQVGAFSFPVGSKDAAMVVTLQPGAYSLQVSGVAGTVGIALAEIYEVQ